MVVTCLILSAASADEAGLRQRCRHGRVGVLWAALLGNDNNDDNNNNDNSNNNDDDSNRNSVGQ